MKKKVFAIEKLWQICWGNSLVSLQPSAGDKRCEFDWQHPRLVDLADVGEIDTSKLFLQVVCETLSRLVVSGRDGVQMLTIMSVALDKEVQQLMTQVELPVLKAALFEAHDMLACMLMLTGSGEAKVEVLDKIFSATKGSRHKLRVSLNNEQFWRDAERKARQSCIAAETFNPEIKSTLQKLSSLSLGELADTVPRLHVWKDGLGAGCA